MNFLIKIKGKLVVSTQDKKTKARSLYINPANGIVSLILASAEIELSTVFGPMLSNLRIHRL